MTTLSDVGRANSKSTSSLHTLVDGVGVGGRADRAVAVSWTTEGAKFERSVTSSAA